MVDVAYRQPDGSERIVDVAPGTSLMEAAVRNGVAGIVGECGGQMMCATCHVYLAGDAGTLPEQTEDEQDMLDLAAAPVDVRSRLSCQLVVSDETPPLAVELPERQV